MEVNLLIRRLFMYKKSTAVFSTTILALLLLVFSAQQSAFALPGNAFVGGWQLTDDTSGNIFLLTASQAGVYTVSFPNAANSEGHGVWRRANAPRTYRTTDISFIYDASGNVILTQKVRARAVLSIDGDSLTANLVIDVINLNGSVVNTITTTATGVRMTVEPF
jgi:hypothetical protein